MAIAISNDLGAAGSDDVASQNFSGFTTPSGCKGLLVAIGIRDGQSVTAITWNGTSMGAAVVSTATSRRVFVFFLADPAIGNLTLAVTYSAACRAYVNFVPLTASGTLSIRASSSERDAAAPVAPQETISSSASDLGVAFLACGTGSDFSGTVTSDGGQTREISGAGSGFRASCYTDSEAGAGSTITMGFSNSNTGEGEPFSLGVVSVQEAATGSASKRMMRRFGL